MPNHIFISRESGQDSISIFYDEPAFLVIANKDDLPTIQLINESKKPGIYILLGDNKRYVGQASNSIFTRLHQHSVNKSWWNRLIFFGREDGHLSKAQLDLLERKIIEKMHSSDIALDNGTQGNQSYIDKLSKFSSLALLSKVERVLVDIANIDLFTIDAEEPDTDLSNFINNGDPILVQFGDKLYTGNSYRELFFNLLSNLILSTEIENLVPIISQSEPSTVQIIGTKERVSAQGKKLTKQVEPSKYYIYINFSKDYLYKKISELAHLTNKPVIFKKW